MLLGDRLKRGRYVALPDKAFASELMIREKDSPFSSLHAAALNVLAEREYFKTSNYGQLFANPCSSFILLFLPAHFLGYGPLLVTGHTPVDAARFSSSATVGSSTL